MAPSVAVPYDAGRSQAVQEPQGLPMTSGPTEWTLGECTRYYRELLAFLTAKLRCPHEAADMAQETFARLYALDDPAAVRQPRAFLYRIARNLAVDAARKQSVRTRHLVELSDLEEAPSAKPRPDDLIPEEQLRRALNQAIVEMPPRRRDVFVLYRFAGLTQAEIADRLGISTSMVERHLMKAMAECRRRLQSYL